jgi:hypothetical protein
VLVIGAKPYRVSEEDARWLEERICSRPGSLLRDERFPHTGG